MVYSRAGSLDLILILGWSWPPTSCPWDFSLCSSSLWRNDITIFASLNKPLLPLKRSEMNNPPEGLIEDLTYLEIFLSDHRPQNKRPEIWSSHYGSSLTSGTTVIYSGANSDGATLWNVKKLMRLERNFLVFKCQKHYQSQTPLLLWTWPVIGRLTVCGTGWVRCSIKGHK